MSAVYVDRSALVALLVPTDAPHKRAQRAFARRAADETPLVTSSDTLVDPYMLLGRRLGHGAVAAFRADFARDWMWPGLAPASTSAGSICCMSRALPRSVLSMRCPFVIAHDREIERVCALDRHFTDARFSAVT